MDSRTIFAMTMLTAAVAGCGGSGGGGGAGTTSAPATAASTPTASTPTASTPTAPAQAIPSELLLARSAPPPGATATWTSDPMSGVTALARVPGASPLAGVGGSIVDVDGVLAPVPLGGPIASIAVASSRIYAAVRSSAGGSASVLVFDGGSWQPSLLTTRRSCVVASLGGSAFAISGDGSGAPGLVNRWDGSSWVQVADLGAFEPISAVELKGQLWIGGVTRSGVARLVHGDTSGFSDEPLPLVLLPGESSSVAALAVANDHLYVAVAVRDSSLAPKLAAVFGITSAGQAVLMDQLADDVALALASWDGALWVGCESGELYLLDDQGQLQLEGATVSGPIRALAGGDSLLVGSDGALSEHAWTPAQLPGGVFAATAVVAPSTVAPASLATTAAMTFTSISPKLGPTTGATKVTITGSNFASITNVTLGGVALTSLSVTSTQIVGVTGAHAAGKVDLVITSSTSGTLTQTGAFTYYVPMTITSVAPTSGPVAGGTSITINGTNFLHVTSVTVGGVALSGLTVTSTQITGKTGAHAPGKVNVIVKSSTNGSVTKKSGFTYGVTIKAISPTSGPPAGGTAVTITGTNFLNITSVQVGGVELSSRVVVSSTKITGVTGAHAAARVDVVVTSSNQGTATKVGGFTYASPTLSFATDVKPILELHCTVCHTQGGVSSFAPFTDTASGPAVYSRVRNGVSTYNTPATYVVPGDAANSLIVVKTQAGGGMADKLSTTEAQKIKDWVLSGANP